MSRVPEEGKKKNPIMKFVTDWIARPVDNINYALYKIAETMGITDALQEMTAKAIEYPIFNTLFSGAYKYEVFNHEVLPKEGPAIICAQHQSLLDPISIGLSIVKYANRVAWHMAKADLAADPYLNVFTRINRAIFVRRGDSDHLAIEQCIKKVEEGNIMVVYPEGTLGPGNGKLLPFRKGVAIIAAETGAPVIPVATYGIDKIFGKGATAPKTKGIIKLKYGELIPAEKLLKKKNKDGTPNLDRAVKVLERKVSNLYWDLHEQFQRTEEEGEGF